MLKIVIDEDEFSKIMNSYGVIIEVEKRIKEESTTLTGN